MNNFGYVWAGANVSSPYATTGLYLTSGKLAYSMYWFGSTSGACAINTSALEDDNFYLCTQTVGAVNISMKMNKLTIVNNAIAVGSDINSTTTAKGTEELTGSFFGVLSACYSNGTYNYTSGNQMVYIEFLDANDNVLLSFNFSEGAGQQVFDVISGNAYAIYNITEADFWNYTQDFNHYNFRHGFTLYQKTGADDIRIPNKKDQSEIVPVSVPSGYSRIANYKECRQTFNQCESLVKLDDVSVASVMTITVAPDSDVVGVPCPYKEDYSGKAWYQSADTLLNIFYYTNQWYVHTPLNTLRYYSQVTSLEVDADINWFDSAGNPITLTFYKSRVSSLYTSDPDHFLFTENTGVAKEFDLKTIDVTTGFNRGFMYINPNANQHDFMLYGNDKTLTDDVKVIKYIGLGNEIVYDETGDVVYDENDHIILE